MHQTTNRSARAVAVDFAQDIAHLWDRQLGQRLIGVYLIGSLAHGGYSARFSDIDIALIVEGALGSGEIDLVNRKVAARSVPLASRLSLFWTDRYFCIGRFPPLDRVDSSIMRSPFWNGGTYAQASDPSEIRAYLSEPSKSGPMAYF